MDKVLPRAATRQFVLAVNLVDVARAQGREPDPSKLTAALGVPAVAVSAHTGEGLDALRAAVSRVLARAEDGRGRVSWSFPAAVEVDLRRLVPLVETGSEHGARAMGAPGAPVGRGRVERGIASVAHRGVVAVAVAVRVAVPGAEVDRVGLVDLAVAVVVDAVALFLVLAVGEAVAVGIQALVDAAVAVPVDPVTRLRRAGGDRRLAVIAVAGVGNEKGRRLASDRGQRARAVGVAVVVDVPVGTSQATVLEGGALL
ncbi:MAG: hypothetical protein FJ090_14145 [Deltaproteobacteria bacterium]|nr:hypothetical protein [Deltaproteobacteria bacterium]